MALEAPTCGDELQRAARREQFDEIKEILGGVPDEASDRMAVAT